MKKTIVDKTIEYFNPVAAMNRYKARMVIGAFDKSAYHGASKSRTTIGNYLPIDGDVNQDTISDLPTLRARSRDLVRNQPVAGGAITTSTTYVVGTGLTLKASIDGAKLGLSGAEAGIWQDDVSSRFQAWAESLDCDAARKLNFYGIQSLAFRSMFESGDIIALLPEVDRYGKKKLAVQLIEADRLCNENLMIDNAGLVAGIELDALGAPVRYHICNQHPTNWKNGLKKSWTKVDAYGAITGQKKVIHYFEQKRPGQVRGIPALAGVIELFKQLQKYTDAELQAAVVSGAFAMFTKMDPNAFNDLFDDAGRKSYLDSSSKWDGRYPESGLSGPGKVVNLLPGEDLVESNPGRPNSEFDPFVQAIFTQIGCDLGLPKEVLIKHFTSSYTAARAALLDAWKLFRVRRETLSMYFCQPIYQDWLAREVAAGNIIARGFFEDELIRHYWSQAEWIGDGPGSIDPIKEATAAQQRIDMGISTVAAESILHDGGDWWSKHKQRSNEHAQRVKAGLEPEQPVNQPIPVQTNGG